MFERTFLCQANCHLQLRDGAARFFLDEALPPGAGDLYCNVRFTTGQCLTVEHAYAAERIATHHGCPNRNECPILAYGFVEGDLHNLWPAIGAINSSECLSGFSA